MHRVTVAVIASWLPRYAPPVGDNDFDKPYAERLKVELDVREGETLTDVYQRSVAELQPRLAAGEDPAFADPMTVVRWAMFYEPGDDDGIGSGVGRWLVPEDLTVVGADGRARWNRSADQIALGDLVRSHEAGLLTGDPLRPYLVLLLPQGGEAYQAAWDVASAVWAMVGHVLTARELVELAWRLRQRRKLRRQIEDGGRVLERYRDQWAEVGGGPTQILETLERRPWPLDDLRILLGLESTDDAARVLELHGFRASEDGEYVLGEDDESRLLSAIARASALGEFGGAELEPDAEARLHALLVDGQLPPRD